MKQSLWHCTLSCNIFNGDHMQVFFFFFFFFSWNFTVQNTDVLIHFYQWLPNFPKDRMQQERLGKLASCSGDPQGCVFSSLLFSSYTNDCTSGDTRVLSETPMPPPSPYSTLWLPWEFSVLDQCFVKRPSRGCIFCAWSCYLGTVNVLVGHKLGTTNSPADGNIIGTSQLTTPGHVHHLRPL